MAALALFNFFVFRRFHFLSFYTVADETYYVPHVTVRNFLMANKKMRIKDFENRLIYTFTFGGIERFGLQTRNLYDFFTNRRHRFDRKRTQAVIEDVQKFSMERRIGGFVNEEQKANRIGDADYDIGTGGRPGGQVRLGDAPEDDDAPTNARERGKARVRATIREVETTLKLSVLYDELSKMKSIAATLFPQQARKYRLAEKLNGTFDPNQK